MLAKSKVPGNEVAGKCTEAAPEGGMSGGVRGEREGEVILRLILKKVKEAIGIQAPLLRPLDIREALLTRALKM